MRGRTDRRHLLVLLLAGALLAAACRSTDPYPEQLRIATRPTQARLVVPELGLELYTPATLPEEVDEDAEIELHKEGYVSYRGPISGLSQVADRSFVLTMQPMDR